MQEPRFSQHSSRLSSSASKWSKIPKGFIEAETSLPAASQAIYMNGQAVANETKTLEEALIKDGEMLAVVIRQARPAATARRSLCSSAFMGT